MSSSNEKSKFEKEREEAEARKQKQEDIIAELKNNPAFMQYFAQYAETDVNAFLAQYAQKKVTLLEWGPRYLAWQEKEDLHWEEEAVKRIQEIQQKKLFDAQCLWRAEQLHIDEIEISADFFIWEKKILTCPFIDPVSAEDIDRYYSYLTGDNYEHYRSFLSSWQNYDFIKAAYNDEPSLQTFPRWYDYHNGVTGNGILLSLPDIRGEKEAYYLSLVSADERKKKPVQPAATQPPTSATKPDINYMKEGFLRRFVETYDTEETLRHFNNWGGDKVWDEDETSEREEEARRHFELLSQHGEVFPIKAAPDWFTALRRCVYDYSRHKIAEALLLAFEQYNMYRSSFISPPSFMDAWLFDTAPIKSRILQGRRLAAEPEDFNF